VLKFGPKEISLGVAQLVTPTTHAESTSAMSIKVRPGTARVPIEDAMELLVKKGVPVQGAPVPAPAAQDPQKPAPEAKKK